METINNDQLLSQQSSSSNKSLITTIIGILIFILTIGFSYYLGYRTGGNSSTCKETKTDKIPSSIVVPTERQSLSLPANTPTTTPSILDFFEKPNNEMIEICGEKWEEIKETDQGVECLIFFASGRIDKTIDGKVVSTNDGLPREEYGRIAQEVNNVYDELNRETFKKWLLKIKAPIVGRMMSQINTYARSKETQPVSEQLLITKYIWGADYSPESKRLQEIFDKLKAYSSTVNKGLKQTQ